MTIRHYQPGDETAQVAIYNAAAAEFPKFKPATAIEALRRIRVRDFDPTTRFYAEHDGQIVGYGVIHSTGRISYPWVLAGYESHREALFEAMLAGLRTRGIAKAWAAYRSDWTEVQDAFRGRGFAVAREMVNFFINFHDMPTPSYTQTQSFSPIEPADIPTILEIGAGVIGSKSASELEQHLLKNPHFLPDASFVLRSRLDRRVLAAAIFVSDLTYADPEQVDASMPCFRLGAYGTEGLTWKRVNGLFSFIARPDRSLNSFGLELMGEAAGRVRDGDPLRGLAAQAPSDAPHLLDFYKKHFRRQGSFPILEAAV